MLTDSSKTVEHFNDKIKHRRLLHYLIRGLVKPSFEMYMVLIKHHAEAMQHPLLDSINLLMEHFNYNDRMLAVVTKTSISSDENFVLLAHDEAKGYIEELINELNNLVRTT